MTSAAGGDDAGEAAAAGSEARSSISLITGEVAAPTEPARPPAAAVVSELYDEDPLLLRHRAPHATHDDTASNHNSQTNGSSRRLVVISTTSVGPSRRAQAHRIVADSAVQVRYSVPLDTTEAAESNDRYYKKNDDHGMEEDDDDDDDEASCWKWITSKMQLQRVAARQAVLQQKTNYKTAVQEYNAHKLFQDVIAGITVAVMAVPLGMSYARLAGLPAYYGLYGTFLPPLIYPIFGSCRHLAVGPAALVSLLIGAGVGNIVRAEYPELANADETDPAFVNAYTQLAIQCSLLVGIVNLAMGLLRCGFVTQFLSRALISGFTSGASIIIAVSQIKYLFGYAIPTSNQFHNIIKYLVENIDEFNWRTFVMGTVSIILMLSLKQISNKYPKYAWIQALGPFVVSVATIVVVYVMDLDVPVVGAIPPGLPSVTIAQWSPLSNRLWTIVLSIVIVAFVQSFAIAKRMAYKHGYEVDANQELMALGIANFIGAMFQSYPTTGALGQSAINESVGAQTGLSSCVTAAAVMCVLLFLTPVFEYMPLAALGAIVISYVLGMFDYPEAIYLWKVHKFDFTVWMAAFLGTIFLGVEPGLVIAVGASLLIVIYEAAYPHTSVLGRLPQTSLYRNVKQYPNLERYDGLVIVRLNSPLFFANAQSIRDKIRKYKRTANEELAQRNAGQVVQYIILDLAPVTHIDTTALHALDDMCKAQLRLGTQMCFCNPSISLMIKLVKSGLVEVVGRDHIFPAVTDAVHWCLLDMDSKDTVVPTEAVEQHVAGQDETRNGGSESAALVHEERNESAAQEAMVKDDSNV